MLRDEQTLFETKGRTGCLRMSDKSRKFSLAWLPALLLLLAAVLFLVPSAAGAETKEIHTDKVNGTVSNLDWSYLSVRPDIDVEWDGIIPSISFSMSIRVGGSADFDLSIREGSLPAGTQPGDHVTDLTPGVSSFTLKENIFDGIPKVGIGSIVKAKMIIGATRAVDVKGRFNIAYEITISTDTGLNYGGRSDITYTSIKPREKDQETVVCVGTDVGGEIQLGVFGWMGVEIGPIVRLDLSLTDTGMASATLEKDEWHATIYQKDDVNELHTCAEYGKPGCVSGRMVNTVDISADGHAHVKIPIIDMEIIGYDWSKPKYRNVNKDCSFHHSLTWNESLQENKECDHRIYKVPVYVWLDEGKQMPANDILVKNKDQTQGDATAKRFDKNTSGHNPYLGAGRANIYLPYKEGKYTITADTRGTQYTSWGGEAEMPTPMRRGANDRVDIILRSVKTRTFSVEKKWDIDFENKDRPESIDVLLQAQYYNTGRFTWVGVQKATLSADNNWSFTFDPVPKSELDDRGNARDIKYRVRELKQAPSDDAPVPEELEPLFPEDIVDVLPDADGIYRPDEGTLAQYSKRVVPARWDLDNTHVWEVLKKTVTDFNTLWDIDPSMDYLSKLAKESFFPEPTVSYKVAEYTSIVGETVEEHETKYKVDYKVEGDKTTITNMAILETAIYKRWVLFGDAQPPDEVWVMLGYRIKEEYRQYVGGEAAEKYLGLWLPVWRPLDGDVASIFTALASATDVEWLKYLDYLITLDIKGSGNLSFAIARLKKPDSGAHNPLMDWRARFKTKKYGWFIVPGMPVEFQAMELSSAVITDVLKYLTGLDIPISAIINPSGLYITVPGKSIQIPVLDKDWERTANVINTWYDSGSEEPIAIGGTKVWAGDTEEDRPEELTIIVKDGDLEVGRTTIKKSDNEGQKSWIWTLKQSQVTGSVRLDPERTYTVTEEYPENYAHKNDYVLSVDGHNLTNTFVKADKPPKIVIRKVLQHTGLSESRTFRFNLYDDKGIKINGSPYTVTMTGEGTESVTAMDISPEMLKGRDLNRFRVEEVNPPEEYDISTSGPVQTTEKDGTPVYTFTVTNTAKDPSYFLQADWEGDTEADRPAKVDLQLTDHSFAVTAEEGWKQYFHPSWQPKPTKETAGSLFFRENPVPSGYQPNPAYDVLFEGDRIGWRVTNTKTGPVTVQGQKTWEGDAESDRPGTIHIQIANNRDGIVRTVDITAAGGWKWSVDGLPAADEEGNPLKYYVTESTSTYNADNEPMEYPGVKGYTTEYKDPVWNEAAKTWTCDITNSRVKLRYILEKTWEDNEDAAGLRPEKVTVEIRAGGAADGDPPAATAELSEGNNWRAVLSLPKLPEGQAYTVTEAPVAHYTTAVQPPVISTDSVLTKITNTLAEDRQISVTVWKTWAEIIGPGITPAEHPASITFDLKQNGTTIRSETLPDENGRWGKTFTVPLLDGNGMPYTYTVEETGDVLDEYIPEYEITETADGLDVEIVNRDRDQKRSIRFRKTWGTGTAPAEVTIRLVRNNVPDPDHTQAIPADDAGDWYAFENLPVLDGEGNLIRYTVEEVPVPDDCICSITGSMRDGFTVNNSRNENLTSVKVTKVWDPEPTWEPDSVAIRLVRKDTGAVVGNVYLPTDGTTPWTYTFEGLQKFVYSGSGLAVPIEYTVEEDPVPGYTSELTGNQAEGYLLTNRQDTYDRIYVTKIWDDRNDEDGLRPDDIGLHLVKNGTEYGDTEVTVRRIDGSWNYEILPAGDTRFPIFENGEKAEYSIREDPVADYEEPFLEGDAESGFRLVNRHTPQRRDLLVIKDWNTEDGKGPGPVKVTLESDKEEKDVFAPVGSAEIKGPDWQAVFKNLPIRSGKRVIRYRATEEVPKGYEDPLVIYDGEDIRIENRESPPTPAPTPTETPTEKPTREPTPYSYRFAFTKKWSGGTGNSIEWTLYNGKGEVVHKKFNKETVSATEWAYEAWFEAGTEDYYIIEEVPRGFRVRYENTGIHADVTDRCYNGGKIINYRIPKTEERGTNALPWILCLAAGMLGILLARIVRKRTGGR